MIIFTTVMHDMKDQLPTGDMFTYIPTPCQRVVSRANLLVSMLSAIVGLACLSQ